jgi:S-disulfanyl-L-cysteine oxidoreductase SoxD
MGMRATLFLVAAASLLGCAEAGDRPRDGGAGLPSAASAFTTAEIASSERVPDRLGFGRAATPQEIAEIDIDVMPDGTGLPPGEGTVAAGATLYAARCAQCHGATGEGVPGAGDVLAGWSHADIFDAPGEAGNERRKTIGSYWPFATTLFDYIRRAMPFDRPGSLTDPEVYALTAYLLHLNEIIPGDAVIDARTLPAVRMPAADRLVEDDRETSNVVR